MKLRVYIFFTVGIVALTIVSCDDSSTNSLGGISTPVNTPVIVNTINAFTFTVNADAFSISQSESLFFNTDSLVVSLTVANYSAGDGDIFVLTSDSLQIFSEILNSNKVVLGTDIVGNVPDAVSIRLSGFTGSVTFVLGKETNEGG